MNIVLFVFLIVKVICEDVIVGKCFGVDDYLIKLIDFDLLLVIVEF